MGRITNIQRLFAERINTRNRNFYKPPEVRQLWGEDQEELENTWGELFFDLIYVAVSFRVGEQIVADFQAGNNLRGLLFSYSTFTIMYDAWIYRLAFLSRFVTEDSFHKLFDILVTCVCAFMALNIVTSEEFLSEGGGSYNYAFFFTCARMLQMTMEMFKYWEFQFISNYKDQGLSYEHHVKPALRFFVKSYLLTGIFTCMALYTSYNGYIQETCYLWLASVIVPNYVVLMVLLYWNAHQKTRRMRKAENDQERAHVENNGIPINVQFYIDRLYEFVMLLNGEGVLQIIILEIDPDHTGTHIASFILCFLLLSLITYMQFNVLPSEADDSVIRKSRWRTPLMFFFWPVFCLSIVYFGVSLKLILKNHYKSGAELQQNAWLMCASLTMALMLLFFNSLLNVGPYELVFNQHFNGRVGAEYRNWYKIREQMQIPGNVSIKRVFVFLLMFLSPLSFLVLPSLNLDGVLLLCVSTGIMLAIVGIVNKYVRVITEKKADLVEPDGDEVQIILKDKDQYNKADIIKMFGVWKDRTEELVNDFNAIDEEDRTPEQANELHEEVERLQDMLAVIAENLVQVAEGKGSKAEATFAESSTREKALPVVKTEMGEDDI